MAFDRETVLSAGNDTFTAPNDTREDKIKGMGGNDTINGGGGEDEIFGDGEPFNPFDIFVASGNDTLHGNDGNDIIHGGRGNDIMSGGGQIYNAAAAGNDTFVWDFGDVLNPDGSKAGFDTITDFAAGDKLDFTGLFAGRGITSPSQFIHVTDTAAGTVVSVDMGGTAGFMDVVLLQDMHVANVDELMPHIVI